MIVIKKATQNNVMDCISACRCLFSDSKYSSTGGEFDVDQVMANAWVIVSRDDYGAWLAYDGDKVIGFLAGHISETLFDKQLSAFDDLFYVLPESQNNGAGKQLFHAYESWARERGATKLYITLTSDIDTENTLQKIQSQGFEHWGSVVCKDIGNNHG